MKMLNIFTLAAGSILVIKDVTKTGTGSGERGTGNGERGTGNGSLGTSSQR